MLTKRYIYIYTHIYISNAKPSKKRGGGGGGGFFLDSTVFNFACKFQLTENVSVTFLGTPVHSDTQAATFSYLCIIGY